MKWEYFVCYNEIVLVFDNNVTLDKIHIFTYNGIENSVNPIRITYSTKSIASRNPIRYRGYYYDDDTKLYYLNARYYSPEWRRFISPDDTAYLNSDTTTGLNLYCYCNNDPVNYADPSGQFPITALLIGIGVGALLGGIAAGISSSLDGNTDRALVGDIFGGALIGVATGAAYTLGGLAGMGTIGVKAAVISLGASTAVSFGAGVDANIFQSISRGEDIDWHEALQDGAFTATQSAISFWVGASMSYGGLWKSLNSKSYTSSIALLKCMGENNITSVVKGTILYLELFGKDMIIRSGVKFLYTYWWSYLRKNN